MQRYPASLRLLHWTVALLVLATWPLGIVIKFIRDDVKLSFYLIHESLGFLLLWIMLARVIVRLTSRVPDAVSTGLSAFAAEAVHRFLYAFLVIMPVSGFLATNAHGFPLTWFGFIPIWSPIGKDPSAAPWLSTIHTWSAWILLAFIALHLAGVLFHHVVRRDNTLFRML